MRSLKTTFSKKDIENRFNISLATVNNWIKTGVIPAPSNGCYTKDVYNSLVEYIELNSDKLQSRANRSCQRSSDIVFLGIKEKERRELLVNLVKQYENSHVSVLEAVSCLGKQILSDNRLYDEKSEISAKINKIYSGANIFQNIYIENKDDDILGAFYQSVQSIACKSKDGSFYTPCELLSSINIPVDAKVLDPCCGSGSILINTLSKKHNPSNVYAFDIDETALLICHINLVLFFEDAFISPHIEKHNLIFPDEKDLFLENEKYDFIVTNPPWGSKLSKEEKKFLLSDYPFLDTTEVFSIALYNSILKLSVEGKLKFFLPESILNVASHKNIRKFLLDSGRNMEIVPLGNAFKGIQSECILLGLSEIIKNRISITVVNGKKYNLSVKTISAPFYFISYSVSEDDDKILNKIYSAKSVNLSSSTKFALGIITGNNKKYIHKTKGEKEEAVFRGKDILPYRLKSPETYIYFTPDTFQQVAPVEMYRSKKIVYRFISDRIVCALDDGSLVLNSANAIISDDYPMEILVCLFNSPIYTFIYQKKFKSKKVLKQHFQDFPLPVLNNDLIELFCVIYTDILSGIKNQNSADKVICDYFKISDAEYNYIKNCVS